MRHQHRREELTDINGLEPEMRQTAEEILDRWKEFVHSKELVLTHNSTFGQGLFNITLRSPRTGLKIAIFSNESGSHTEYEVYIDGDEHLLTEDGSDALELLDNVVSEKLVVIRLMWGNRCQGTMLRDGSVKLGYGGASLRSDVGCLGALIPYQLLGFHREVISWNGTFNSSNKGGPELP